MKSQSQKDTIANVLTKDEQLEDFMCCICQSVVSNSRKPVKLRACNHLYCWECLQSLINSLQPDKKTGKINKQ